jgi:ATP/maltotriose-dependent transcriptional regulator MalT
LGEIVEAGVRTGERELASDAVEQLTAIARITPTAWALGIEARSRALLSDGAGAEDLYLRAISHLEQSEARIELARAHLLYGEWLRRDGRRTDARGELRTAYDEFTVRGFEAFAHRALAELQVTGEKVRKRTIETRDDLTAQEWQIAGLACEGLSNPEIGARLFLSPRTIEWHLRKVFFKLGISSRRQLSGALPGAGSELVGAGEMARSS